MLLSQQRQQRVLLIATLAIIGIVHRSVVLATLWPQLANLVPAMGAQYQSMQLLPRDILLQAPWPGLLYLQMTPPLPNVIFALLLHIVDPYVRVATLLLLQGAISILTAIAMAWLLLRLRLPCLIATATGVAYLLWGDLVFLEYISFGFLFHESLSMLLCVVTCHVALSTQRHRSAGFACGLGTCVALLALTRATFAYFFIVVLIWFVATGLWRQRRLLPALLLPMLLLHGGWALKNWVLQDNFSLSTSTWGGANLLHGELARDSSGFYPWLAQQQGLCDAPWEQMTRNPQAYFLFIVNMENAADVPAAIASADHHIAQRRGGYVNRDSAAAREFSACLQREFLQFWLQNPRHAVRGWWRSYQRFWLPLRYFAEATHLPVSIAITPYEEGFHFLRMIANSIAQYRQPFLLVGPGIAPMAFDASKYQPIDFLVLPALGSLMSAMCAILFHAAILTGLLRGRRAVDDPLLLPLLMIVYVAVLTSIVEYPENMRFRLSVEPLLWAVGLATLHDWFKKLAALRNRPPVHTAS